MINTFHTSLPPPPVPPRLGHRRSEPRQNSPLVWFLSVVLVLHMIVTLLGFIYLFQRSNQGNQISQLEARADKLSSERLHQPLAHMSLKNNNPTCTVEDKVPCVLVWNNDHSVRVNVDTEGPSRLKIKQTGYYYVYSQVTFSKRDVKTSPQNSIIKSTDQSLRETHNKKDEVLLDSYCSVGYTSQCSAFQGGIFKLEQDEELYVRVTNLTWVSPDWNSTFFGLYKLPNDL
ncbi:CD40 ligand [Denticeps clupeoides]|uniref:THD domain-containing protein n=1 Tax=Denticeps clupeoides TaxID=299321 RepID=A0AAY4C8X2_9TELE|nr:tumor necrosis factor ligand superfamily member 6-like [Denticeps clupeoides]